MGTVYTHFLKDYGIQNIKNSICFLFFIVYIWVMLVGIRKAIKLPTKLSRLTYVIVYSITILTSLGYIYQQKQDIGLLFSNVKTEKQFIAKVNKLLENQHKPTYEGKSYTLSVVEEKIKHRGSTYNCINTYYYKIDKVTQKNIKPVINQYSKVKYASINDFVHNLDSKEYNEYILKLEEEKKKDALKAKQKKTKEVVLTTNARLGDFKKKNISNLSITNKQEQKQLSITDKINNTYTYELQDTLKLKTYSH